MSNVVILGASPKPNRFAYKALCQLISAGHSVFPVHPKATEIEGNKVYACMADIKATVDTVTLYIGPERMQSQTDALLALKPQRVIFNPGTEAADIENKLQAAGIECITDCTLIMLDEQRF